MRLERIQSEFWDYQATVTEDGIIAKILRGIERPPSIQFELLTAEQHDSLDTYESIGFFKPVIHQRIAVATPIGGTGAMKVVASKPAADIGYRKIGQAQLWYSTTSGVCVLWECLAFGEMKPRVKELWTWTLEYIDFLELKEIYTHSRDQAYETEAYDRLLKSLGFREIRPSVMKK